MFSDYVSDADDIFDCKRSSIFIESMETENHLQPSKIKENLLFNPKKVFNKSANPLGKSRRLIKALFALYSCIGYF